MHKVIIIIMGLFLLSETNVYAANLKNQDGAMHQIDTCLPIINCDTTQSESSNVDDFNMTTSNNDRLNSVDLNENDPPQPDRGSPDNRGGGSR